MIGKLQSNKAKKAVEIFDYIHSVDSQKLANTLSKCQNELNKSLNNSSCSPDSLKSYIMCKSISE